MSNNILKITFTASTINGIILRNYTYTPAISNPYGGSVIQTSTEFTSRDFIAFILLSQIIL